MNFDSFQLNPRLTANVGELGYQEPTPIQAQTIPAILRGRDVLGLAQTGTGKTAAFGLPILQRLQDGPRGRLRVLVVAPTRELAEQIHSSFRELGNRAGYRGVTVYGGVPIRPQIKALRGGAEVVVACPGRLLDHMRQGTVRLDHVEVLVLDEADRMFDMGFLPSVREIVRNVPAERQTLLFSATMPKDIEGLAAEILDDPVKVTIGHAAPVETVSHSLYPVEPHLKTKLLLELLQRTPTGSVLIFTRTKHRAKRIGEQLAKAGHKASSLQGNLSQNRRRAAMDGFRDGTHQILVATDIAARGIDVSTISHVINYDMPDTVDAYTHRIGRTGRAEKSGDAITFTTRDDSDMVRLIERVLGSPIDRHRLEGFDYTAPGPARNTEFARGPRPTRQRGRKATGERRGPSRSSSASPARASGRSKSGRAQPSLSGPAGSAGSDGRSVTGGTYVPLKERPIQLSSHTVKPAAQASRGARDHQARGRARPGRSGYTFRGRG